VSAEDILCEMLTIKCIKGIRDFFECVLYKFALGLLPYCVVCALDIGASEITSVCSATSMATHTPTYASTRNVNTPVHGQ